MASGKWKAGDLVRVESVQKTGWGDERDSHLVLVLRIYNSKFSQPKQQHYPLTAYLDELVHKDKDVLYEVLRDDGKYLKLGLEDYAWSGVRLTNRLVQRSCAED